MVEIGKNGQIRPSLPPMKNENRTNLGKILWNVIKSYQGHVRKRFGKEKAFEIQEKRPIFMFYEISHT